MRKIRYSRIIFYLVILMTSLLLIILGYVILKFRGSMVVHANENVIPKQEVKFYRQDDERWAEDKMGDSIYTLRKSGCLVTCIASAVTMVDKEKTPHNLNEEFSLKKIFDSEGNILWNNLRDTGMYEVDVFQEATSELLIDCLKNGKYPIIRVRMNMLGNFHYVLIVKAENEEFYCMDPLKDEIMPLSEYGNRVYAIRCVSPIID